MGLVALEEEEQKPKLAHLLWLTLCQAGVQQEGLTRCQGHVLGLLRLHIQELNKSLYITQSVILSYSNRK